MTDLSANVRSLPFADQLRLPLIAAPMLRVSGPELVMAACRAGVIGAFPTANCRDNAMLEAWMSQMRAQTDAARGQGLKVAPFCPNLIMRRSAEQLRDDVATIVRHRTEVVITSVGSPASVIPTLHDAGCKVLADVASLRHAEKAIEAGVDGLILLVAGAGGQTGWANPFAYVRALRAHYDGLLVMAGGISDGVALRAAITLGCDMAYMGTRFIATTESMADPAYRQMLVDSSMDDIKLTRAITSLPTSFLIPSLRAVGLEPDELPENLTAEESRQRFGGGPEHGDRPKRWSGIWSAGHSVSGVQAVCSTAQLVDEVAAQFAATR